MSCLPDLLVCGGLGLQDGFLAAEMDDVEKHLLLGRGRFSSVYAGLYKKQSNQHGALSPQKGKCWSLIRHSDHAIIVLSLTCPVMQAWRRR